MLSFFITFRLDGKHRLEVEQCDDGRGCGADDLRPQHAPHGRVGVAEPAEVGRAVGVAGDADRQADGQRRHTEPGRRVERHPAVVDVSDLAQHPVDVGRVDRRPGEQGHREVVKAGRHQGAQEPGKIEGMNIMIF